MKKHKTMEEAIRAALNKSGRKPEKALEPQVKEHPNCGTDDCCGECEQDA
jgi:hypothetical protein